MTSANIVSGFDLPLMRQQLSHQTIVLATGCFDILHGGHLYFLREASAQGNVLVVGVNSDRSIKLMKGPHRPIVGQDERAELIAALRIVNFVFIFDNTVADEYIINLKPDVFAIGEESVRIFPSESIAAIKVGARVHVVTRIPSASTSSIVTKMQKKIEI